MVESEQLSVIMDMITRVFGDYEISERCTEVAVLDDTNEKLLNRYCACLMVDGKSKQTIYAYRRACQKLADFTNKNLPEIDIYEIRYFLAYEKQRGLANSTLENLRSDISAFFSWMFREKIIKENVMDIMKPIKVHTEVKKPFSDVEIDLLRMSCNTPKERALIEFLLSSGVRVEELSEMKISDVDLLSMSVHVVHGKGDKERITYISNVGREHLVKYLSSRDDKLPHLFINKNYGMLGTAGIRYILNSIAERAGVDNVHPHRFRRTFATNLAARGMDIQAIQKLLGHSKIDTTLRYVSTSDSQVRELYNRYIA